MKKILGVFYIVSLILSVGAEELYCRVRLEDVKPDTAPVRMRLQFYWASHRRIGAAGLTKPGTPAVTGKEQVLWKSITAGFQKGEISEYVNIGALLPEKLFGWPKGKPAIFAMSVQSPKGDAKRRGIYSWSDVGNVECFRAVLEFTDNPESGVKHRVVLNSDHAVAGGVIPPGWEIAEIANFTTLLKAQKKALEKIGCISLSGKTASKAAFRSFRSVRLPLFTREEIALQREILNYLGESVPCDSFSSHPVASANFWKFDPWEPGAVSKKLLSRQKPSFGKGTFVKIGDEASLPKVSSLNKSVHGLRRFKEFLKQHGETPESLGLSDWSALTGIEQSQVNNRQNARLYRRTVEFLQQSNAEICAEFTKDFHRKYGDDIELFSDVCRANRSFAQVQDYFYEARFAAFDRQGHHYGSGDKWGPGDYTANIFLADLMRSAALSGTIRPGLMMMPCRIVNEEGILQGGITALARGFDFLFLYGMTPWFSGGEWFFDAKEKIYGVRGMNQLMKIYHQITPFLNIHYRSAARVALVLDRGGDLWRGYNNLKQSDSLAVERRMMNFFLSVNGYYVEIIPEEDLNAARLASVRAVFVISPHLDSKTHPVLKQFVENGGVLYLGAGAAKLDSDNQTADMLETTFGVKDKCIKVIPPALAPAILHETSLYRSVGKAQIKLNQRNYPVTGFYEKLTVPRGGKNILRYADLSPALWQLKYGRGTIYRAGFQAAITTALSATPSLREKPDVPLIFNTFNGYKFTPKHDYAADLAKMPAELLLQAGIEPDFKLSQPGIDAGLLNSPDGSSALLLLSRYTTGKGKITIGLPPGTPEYSKMKVIAGKIPKLFRDGKWLTLELELDTVAVILLSR